MSVRSSLARFFGGAATTFDGSAFPYRAHVETRIAPVELPPAALYSVLRLFDLSNGVYDDLARANTAIGRASSGTKSIRNPVPAVCDAWAAKLWPEPLTVKTDNAAIVDPLALVWRWSNFRASRAKVARWTALYGEAWITVKADQDKGRVWFEYLEPIYITDFAEDARGYVQMVRVDIPSSEETDSGWRLMTHTETWDADTQTYRRWLTEGDACGRRLTDLGAPVEEESLSAFGIDFVPFVRIPFSDSGEKRGIGAVQRALESVAEADLSATNLHAMVYQDAVGAWVVTANGTDANGRPIPPMRVADAAPTFDALGRQTSDGTGAQADGTVSVGKRSFWRLPGGYSMESVVPNIDYSGSLAILQDHDTVLERLMPALAYARLADMGGPELSGRALRYKLTAFIDQVIGVRSTALEKLEQADAMALTLGKVNGIAGFDAIGEFDNGDFQHDFETVDVIPLNALELAEESRTRAQALQAYAAAGFPLAAALKDLGYTDDEAQDVVEMALTEADSAMQRQQDMMMTQGADPGIANAPINQ